MTEERIYPKKTHHRLYPRDEKDELKIYLQKTHGSLLQIYENFTELIQLLSKRKLTDDDKDYYVRRFKYCLKQIEPIKETLEYYVEGNNVQ